MTNELIEAMARALWPYRQCDFANPGFRADREGVYRQARAALAAAEAAGYRLVREVRECRHCGWLCAPNSAQAKGWYPLTPEAEPDHVADASKKEVGRE